MHKTIWPYLSWSHKHSAIIDDKRLPHQLMCTAQMLQELQLALDPDSTLHKTQPFWNLRINEAGNHIVTIAGPGRHPHEVIPVGHCPQLLAALQKQSKDKVKENYLKKTADN